MDYAADKARRRALGHDHEWLTDFRARLTAALDVQAVNALGQEAYEHGLAWSHVLGYWIVIRGYVDLDHALVQEAYERAADLASTNSEEDPHAV